MFKELNSNFDDFNDKAFGRSDDACDRLDELLSLFFDDCLDDAEAAELNSLLLTDPAARTRSFEAAQLHADLYAYFREEKVAKSGGKIAPALPLPIPGVGFSLFK
jgi:hypothetical protein